MASQDLTLFKFDSKEIRVTDQNGDPWFVLRDLLDAMESATKVTDAVESIKQGLGDGFVNDVPILDSLGRKQTAIIVSEPAATYLLSRSNTAKGRDLNRFIHVEVLPSIRKTGGYAVPKSKPLLRPREIREAFSCCMAIAKLCGLKGNQAALSADIGTRTLTGVSALALVGQTHLKADLRGRSYTPTDLGKMMLEPLSGKAANKLFEERGYQVRDIKNGIVPTEAAQGLYEWSDTNKRHSDGTPIKQLKWFVGVLDALGVAYQQIDGQEAA